MATLSNAPGRQTLPNDVNAPATYQTLPADVNAPVELTPMNATPNNMPQTDPLAGMNVSDTAKGLYVDPTPIYQPTLDFIGQQETRANERYAQNKADIANIFGNLTQVNKESQARVTQQFEKSIANQQLATAQRVAEARAGQEATQASALRAMDERGGGPMSNLAESPTAQATERGIARTNQLSTIWEGMQGAIGQQTQQNLQANLAGLGQREVDANMQLKRSLEDTLNQLSGQRTGVMSELAQAIYGGQSQVAQANYNEILSQQAADEARRLASIRGYYDVQQAAIDAQNKLDLAELNAQNRVIDYSDDSKGVELYLRNNGIDDPSQFWATVDAVDISMVNNANDAYRMWLNSVGSLNPSNVVKNAARDWFNSQRYYRPTNQSVPDYSGLGIDTPPSTMPGN